MLSEAIVLTVADGYREMVRRKRSRGKRYIFEQTDHPWEVVDVELERVQIYTSHTIIEGRAWIRPRDCDRGAEINHSAFPVRARLIFNEFQEAAHPVFELSLETQMSEGRSWAVFEEGVYAFDRPAKHMVA